MSTEMLRAEQIARATGDWGEWQTHPAAAEIRAANRTQDEGEVDDDRDADRGEGPGQREVDVEAVADKEDGDGLAEHGEPAQQDQRADADATLGGPEARDGGRQAGVLNGHRPS